MTGAAAKIVCTIGPASASPAGVDALIDAGMDVARLNFSHGNRVEHGRTLDVIRASAARVGASVAVLQDLGGPKVRVGNFPEGHVRLEEDQPFTLTSRPVEGSARQASISYRGLPDEISPGDALWLADGAIELRVERVHSEDIHCRVVAGGRLDARKGINVPSGLSRLPILGEKDLDDLRFGLEHGVDYVALSFVRTAADVRASRTRVEELGGHAPLIAKIETRAALADIDDIVNTADAIMIARGDLAIETPYAEVPLVQKRLIALANRRARPVITATQMLVSMVAAPRPTRAEAADVANAILDGSSAVMLSEETAVGRDPARATRVMREIIRAVSRSECRPGARLVHASPAPDEDAALAAAACEMARRIEAAAIVVRTGSGETARLVASHHPDAPILAVTRDSMTFRRLALLRGVVPALAPETAPSHPLAALRAAGVHVFAGQRVVIVEAGRLSAARVP